MKKKLFAAFVAALLLLQTSTAASGYVRVTGMIAATVVEIFDGDAMMVKNIANGQLSLVRLIGVKAEGNTRAYEYVTTLLLGQTVVLDTDTAAPVNARFSFVYVSLNGVDVNALLLRLGLVKLDENQKSARRYNDYTSSEAEAKRGKLGVWGTGGAGSYYAAYIGDNPVNINTASESQLVSAFGISSATAKSVISYRAQNPFNEALEIRFAPNFTYENYSDNYFNITVSTNINSADADELAFLGLSAAQIKDLLSERDRLGSFTALTQLYSLNIISRTLYNSISPYIALEQLYTINTRYPAYAVNVNTANTETLQYAGLSLGEAEAVLKYRGNYLIRTIEELERISGFTRTNTNRYQDNLTFITDVNSAERIELSSLFPGNSQATALADKIIAARPVSGISGLSAVIGDSLAAALEDFISFGGSIEPSLTNIITASEDELKAAGLTTSEAAHVLYYRSGYSSWYDLKTDLTRLRAKLTLATNVNTASYDELLALPSITSEIANDIYTRRNAEPFAYLSEIKQICDDRDAAKVYNAIRWYIVFR